MTEKSAEPWASWEPTDGQQGAAGLERLAVAHPAFFAGSTLVGSRCSWLSFYREHRLLELTFVRDGDTGRAFVLDGPQGFAWLNGTSDPIHETNAAESLHLPQAAVVDYVRFFFYFLRGDDGAFVLIESGDEVGPADDAGETGDDDEQALALEDARAAARPLKTRGLDAAERWLLDATVAYAGGLYSTTVAVDPGGAVEMIDDDPIGPLGALVVPEAPALAPEAQPGDSSEALVAGTPGAAAEDSGELSLEREVTDAVVAVLLEDAMRERNTATAAGGMLLRIFNFRTQAGQPIEQLTRLVAESKAMVIIESDIPFVEDVVARLVASVRADSVFVERASATPDDESRCQISVSEHSELFLLSFHTYRTLFDAERIAHELALSDAATLIGCGRVGEVPEPLRRAADLVVTFPRIDRRRFERIFESVFHLKPTAGWDGGSTDWTRYLVPGDFHTPRRLGLGPDDALSLLRDRVEARLSQVTADSGLPLDKLFGLGEARQVAEDMIGDIRSAQSGQIPWSAVDRGLLLVGAPGTGKTSLARAIAKECGVKFVVASAPKWQSAGYLHQHLRAMREDFAEARRFAPAILFIDEVDSIGSREHLEGDNAVYQTAVINALLEEMHGIGSDDPVIVIGATNYPEKVDAALRRAGRLDQVVEIPLPNVEGLEQIFGAHLARFQAEGGELADGIDTRALAETAFGVTGADVEFFVRGAARRARRENRPVGQQDLVAEVTRRPRRADSAPRLTPAEMRRVAVHEAGHTVARLISSTQGQDLTFTSIAPRMDGSLGFTAAMPATTRVLTRRNLLEQLQTVLAGRAAEEVVFGADEIGAGSGGDDGTCDLAVATRLAALIVCRSGLSGDGLLRWTAQPNLSQDDKIDELLSEAYRGIRGRLQDGRALLDHIAAALEDKQELSGSELRQLAESFGSVTAAG